MKRNVLASFSNKIRLQLLICLSEGEKNVSQLIDNCRLSQSAVSQHLEKLRTAGLVTTRREGKEIIYNLHHPKAASISKELLTFAKGVSV